MAPIKQVKAVGSVDVLALISFLALLLIIPNVSIPSIHLSAVCHLSYKLLKLGLS